MVGKVLWTAVLCFFLLGLKFEFFVSVDNRCRTEVNIPGMALNGFVFKKLSVTAPHKCDVRCEIEITCQSYNYNTEEKYCELNNRTKEARPENFRSDPARFYIRRLNGRGMYKSYICANDVFVVTRGHSRSFVVTLWLLCFVLNSLKSGVADCFTVASVLLMYCFSSSPKKTEFHFLKGRFLIRPKIPEISEKSFGNLGIPLEVVDLPFRNFKPECLVEWKAPKFFNVLRDGIIEVESNFQSNGLKCHG